MSLTSLLKAFGAGRFSRARLVAWSGLVCLSTILPAAFPVHSSEAHGNMACRSATASARRLRARLGLRLRPVVESGCGSNCLFLVILHATKGLEAPARALGC